MRQLDDRFTGPRNCELKIMGNGRIGFHIAMPHDRQNRVGA